MSLEYNESTNTYSIKLLPIQIALYNSTKTVAGIYSGRGVGKTYILSWLITLELLNSGKVLAFSQDFRSLTINLFEEIQTRLTELKLPYEYNKQMTSISIPSTGGRVYGYSYERIDSCRSQTNVTLLVCDEIALAPQSLFGTVIPCLRGENIKPKIRFASTPRAGTYWNGEILEHLKTGDWDIFSAPMESNTFLSRESIEASYDSITDENLREQELRGVILDMEPENSIISRRDFSDTMLVNPSRSELVCGIDFARFGVDSSCILLRSSTRILEKILLQKADTSAITAAYNSLVSKYGTFDNTFLDATGGWHIGFYDLNKERYKLTPINFGGKGDEFSANKRTEMYFRLVEAIKSGFYVSDSEIRSELINTTYSMGSNGLRILTPKAALKLRIGHSPDSSDALALTFADRGEENLITPEKTMLYTKILFRS